MIHSMTGFGRAEQKVNDITFLIEIKSLNGKQFDLNLRLPAILKSKEFAIRNTLSQQLIRGSVDCYITLKETGHAKPVTINTDLAKAYFAPINELAQSLQLSTGDILSNILKLPEVITPATEGLSDTDWSGFNTVLQNAINNINEHRQNEGAILEQDILQRIENIETLQKEIIVLAPTRNTKIREQIEKLMNEFVNKDNIDNNRLEQELVYYIEKIDIHEEMIRLKNHCDYFREILNEAELGKGKKIGFIMQELGREINTTGSKAYNSDIQKLVVQMKDELEKAKEQSLNIL
jgi:uncharacterized protein (TIGR00255 family)